MDDIIKIDFIDDNRFNIYYIGNQILRREDEIKDFFKMLNNVLSKRYSYKFGGFYDVNIFNNKNVYILEFKNLDDYGKSDFDITMLLNSIMLYEFEDSELILGEKIYYNNKFYVELDNIIDTPYLFELGKIVYGEEVDTVLDRGILTSI